MKILLIQTGKTSGKYLTAGIDEYTGRLRKYTGFEIITIPELKNTRNLTTEAQKKKEGELILKSLGKDDYVIALDEKGIELSTREFAGQIERTFQLSKKRLVFIIGGPWGLSGEVVSRADFRLSLSRMTFSHQVVRLLFAEQLYRAFTVIKGEPYHHD